MDVIGTLLGTMLTVSITAPNFLKQHIAIQPWQELNKIFFSSIVPVMTLVGLHYVNFEFIQEPVTQVISAMLAFGIFIFLMFYMALSLSERSFVISQMKKYI